MSGCACFPASRCISIGCSRRPPDERAALNPVTRAHGGNDGGNDSAAALGIRPSRHLGPCDLLRASRAVLRTRPLRAMDDLLYRQGRRPASVDVADGVVAARPDTWPQSALHGRDLGSSRSQPGLGDLDAAREPDCGAADRYRGAGCSLQPARPARARTGRLDRVRSVSLSDWRVLRVANWRLRFWLFRLHARPDPRPPRPPAGLSDPAIHVAVDSRL